MTANLSAEGAAEAAQAATFEVNFDSSPTEATQIDDIVERYLKLIGEGNGKLSLLRLELRMDLTAWHLNGAPLDLEKLLAAPDFVLAHDVQGINDHIERTGDPTLAYQAGVFVPRCALSNAEQEA